MQCITSRKSGKMILFLSCPFQKWTRIWALPSESRLSVTLWDVVSVAHKSNVCWRFCPLSHQRIWTMTGSVWGLCGHSKSWNSLGAHLRKAFIILPSACHSLPNSQWVMSEWCFSDCRWNTRWEQTWEMKSAWTDPFSTKLGLRFKPRAPTDQRAFHRALHVTAFEWRKI